MNSPKLFAVLFVVIAAQTTNAHAQDTVKQRSAKRTFVAIETEPQYPGGSKAFYKFIQKNLQYPEVARLIGLSGKVVVSFVIEKDGTVNTVFPVSCLGAGCESEAARVIAMSKQWISGIQNNKPVRVQYTVPIHFGFSTDYGDNSNSPVNIKLKDLRKSDYGFAFYINGKTLTIDEAQAILGKEFSPADILTAEPFDDPQYQVPGKKEVYLIIMKPPSTKS